MNAEMLKQAAQRKSEIDKVAKELGYENASQAAADLRALGVLPTVQPVESPFVEAMMAPEPEIQYDMLSNMELKRICKNVSRRDYSSAQVDEAVKGIGNRYITIAQFNFLLSFAKDIAEDGLFRELVDNIFDLHNYDQINWHYNWNRGNFKGSHGALYPAIMGKEQIMPDNVKFEIGTQKPIEKPVKDLPTKAVKQFKKKEVGIIAAASAFIGFLLGALLF